MATQIVQISYDPDPTYRPDPPLVRPGDLVQFELVDRHDTVTVTFSPSSPFTQTAPFSLNGNSPTASTQTRTVSSGVPDNGRYTFEAVSDEPVMPQQPERPGAVKGGLETTTEPPHPPDER